MFETPNALTPEQYKKLKTEIDPNKVITENKERLANAVHESMANERAEREPIPNVLNDAFISDEIEVITSIGVIKIRKLVALDITIFKLSNSPFYKLMMGDIKEDGQEFAKLFPDEELLFELIYQFTTDVKKVYKELKKNKEAYHENVLLEVGSKFIPSDMQIVLEAILTHIGLTNSAKVEFNAEQSEGAKKKQMSPMISE